MTLTQNTRKMMITVIGILVLVSIVMSGLHYFLDPYNKGFSKYPVVTNLHIIPGTVYLLIAPFQFISYIRNKWINAHIWLGRIISIFAVIVGFTALFMAMIFPFSGLVESISVGFFTILFLVAIVKGIINIRTNNIALHREWMIRAFALGLAIATSRIIFLVLFFSITNPTLAQIKVLFIGCFILAFLTHLILAELWILRTRKVS